MPETCTPSDLFAEATCFECLSQKQLLAIQTYLMAVKAGGSTDVATLNGAAVCFECLSEKELLAIQVYLLCQIVNA